MKSRISTNITDMKHSSVTVVKNGESSQASFGPEFHHDLDKKIEKKQLQIQKKLKFPGCSFILILSDEFVEGTKAYDCVLCFQTAQRTHLEGIIQHCKSKEHLLKVMELVNPKYADFSFKTGTVNENEMTAVLMSKASSLDKDGVFFAPISTFLSTRKKIFKRILALRKKPLKSEKDWTKIIFVKNSPSVQSSNSSSTNVNSSAMKENNNACVTVVKDSSLKDAKILQFISSKRKNSDEILIQNSSQKICSPAKRIKLAVDCGVKKENVTGNPEGASQTHNLIIKIKQAKITEDKTQMQIVSKSQIIHKHSPALTSGIKITGETVATKLISETNKTEKIVQNTCGVKGQKREREFVPDTPSSKTEGKMTTSNSTCAPVECQKVNTNNAKIAQKAEDKKQELESITKKLVIIKSEGVVESTALKSAIETNKKMSKSGVEKIDQNRPIKNVKKKQSQALRKLNPIPKSLSLDKSEAGASNSKTTVETSASKCESDKPKETNEAKLKNEKIICNEDYSKIEDSYNDVLDILKKTTETSSPADTKPLGSSKSNDSTMDHKSCALIASIRDDPGKVTEEIDSTQPNSDTKLLKELKEKQLQIQNMLKFPGHSFILVLSNKVIEDKKAYDCVLCCKNNQRMNLEGIIHHCKMKAHLLKVMELVNPKCVEFCSRNKTCNEIEAVLKRRGGDLDKDGTSFAPFSTFLSVRKKILNRIISIRDKLANASVKANEDYKKVPNKNSTPVQSPKTTDPCLSSSNVISLTKNKGSNICITDVKDSLKRKNSFNKEISTLKSAKQICTPTGKIKLAIDSRDNKEYVSKICKFITKTHKLKTRIEEIKKTKVKTQMQTLSKSKISLKNLSITQSKSRGSGMKLANICAAAKLISESSEAERSVQNTHSSKVQREIINKPDSISKSLLLKNSKPDTSDSKTECVINPSTKPTSVPSKSEIVNTYDAKVFEKAEDKKQKLEFLTNKLVKIKSELVVGSSIVKSTSVPSKFKKVNTNDAKVFEKSEYLKQELEFLTYKLVKIRSKLEGGSSIVKSTSGKNKTGKSNLEIGENTQNIGDVNNEEKETLSKVESLSKNLNLAKSELSTSDSKTEVKISTSNSEPIKPKEAKKGLENNFKDEDSNDGALYLKLKQEPPTKAANSSGKSSGILKYDKIVVLGSSHHKFYLEQLKSAKVCVISEDIFAEDLLDYVKHKKTLMPHNTLWVFVTEIGFLFFKSVYKSCQDLRCIHPLQATFPIDNVTPISTALKTFDKMKELLKNIESNVKRVLSFKSDFMFFPPIPPAMIINSSVSHQNLHALMLKYPNSYIVTEELALHFCNIFEKLSLSVADLTRAALNKIGISADPLEKYMDPHLYQIDFIDSIVTSPPNKLPFFIEWLNAFKNIVSTCDGDSNCLEIRNERECFMSSQMVKFHSDDRDENRDFAKCQTVSSQIKRKTVEVSENVSNVSIPKLLSKQNFKKSVGDSKSISDKEVKHFDIITCHGPPALTASLKLDTKSETFTDCSELDLETEQEMEAEIFRYEDNSDEGLCNENVNDLSGKFSDLNSSEHAKIIGSKSVQQEIDPLNIDLTNNVGDTIEEKDNNVLNSDGFEYGKMLVDIKQEITNEDHFSDSQIFVNDVEETTCETDLTREKNILFVEVNDSKKKFKDNKNVESLATKETNDKIESLEDALQGAGNKFSNSFKDNSEIEDSLSSCPNIDNQIQNENSVSATDSSDFKNKEFSNNSPVLKSSKTIPYISASDSESDEKKVLINSNLDIKTNSLKDKKVDNTIPCYDHIYIIGRLNPLSLETKTLLNYTFIEKTLSDLDEESMEHLLNEKCPIVANSLCMFICNILDICREVVEPKSRTSIPPENNLIVYDLKDSSSEHSSSDATVEGRVFISKIVTSFIKIVNKLRKRLPVVIMPLEPYALTDKFKFSLNKNIADEFTLFINGSSKKWTDYIDYFVWDWNRILETNDKNISMAYLNSFVKDPRRIYPVGKVNLVGSTIAAEKSVWKQKVNEIFRKLHKSSKKSMDSINCHSLAAGQTTKHKISNNGKYIIKVANISDSIPDQFFNEISYVAANKQVMCKVNKGKVQITFDSCITGSLFLSCLNNLAIGDTVLNISFLSSDFEVSNFEIEKIVSVRFHKRLRPHLKQWKFSISQILKTNLRKTLSCESYKTIKCEKSDCDESVCIFYHNEKDRRRNPYSIPYEPALCHHTSNDIICFNGDECRFAHNCFESIFHPSNMYSKLCMDYRTRNECFAANLLCSCAHQDSPETFFTEYWKDTLVLGTPLSVEFLAGAIRKVHFYTPIFKDCRIFLIGASDEFLSNARVAVKDIFDIHYSHIYDFTGGEIFERQPLLFGKPSKFVGIIDRLALLPFTLVIVSQIDVIFRIESEKRALIDFFARSKMFAHPNVQSLFVADEFDFHLPEKIKEYFGKDVQFILNPGHKVIFGYDVPYTPLRTLPKWLDIVLNPPEEKELMTEKSELCLFNRKENVDFESLRK